MKDCQFWGVQDMRCFDRVWGVGFRIRDMFPEFGVKRGSDASIDHCMRTIHSSSQREPA